MDYNYFAANSCGAAIRWFNNTRHMDKVIRYAASGDDPEKFRKLVSRAYSSGSMVQCIHTLCLLLLLMKTDKKEFITVLQDCLAEADNLYKPFSDFTNTLNNIDIAKAMNFISDDFNNKDVSVKSLYVDMNQDHINTPLYYAMITGRTGLFDRYIDSYLQNENDLTKHMLSAIHFRDTKFLDTAFRKGVPFTAEMAAAFCTDKNTVKYLCKNFPEYIFPDMTEDDDPRNNISDFIRLSVKNEDTIRFIRCFINNSNTEKDWLIYGKIPKISRIKASDIDDMVCCFFPHNDEIALIGEAIQKALSDSITVIADSNRVPLDQILNEVGIDVSGIDVTYDISQSDCDVFFTSNMTSVRKFLKENKVIFPKDGFSPTLAALLKYNNTTITRILVENSALTDKNINEAIEFLSENKLFNALNTVNKLYFKAS